MNDITERALLADLGRLKGAHNNAVRQFSGDIEKLTTAIKQCAAEITRLQGVVAQLAQVAQQRQAPRVQVRQPVAQPAVPEATPQPAPAQVVSLPSGWPTDDEEEDADVVE